MHEISVADARQGSFGTERYGDPAAELAFKQAARKATVSRIYLKLPVAVQTEPVGARELRTRVLWPRNAIQW